MRKELKQKLLFKTYTEFCNRADEILSSFKTALDYHLLSIKEYQSYIYNNHKFSDNEERDLLIKDKCWLWLMSYEYEPMQKNDLYSVLGQIAKGR